MYYGKVVAVLTTEDKSFKEAIQKKIGEEIPITEAHAEYGFLTCEETCWLQSDCNFASYDKKNHICYMLEKVNSTYTDSNVESIPIGSCQNYPEWQKAEEPDTVNNLQGAADYILARRNLLENAIPTR